MTEKGMQNIYEKSQLEWNKRNMKKLQIAKGNKYIQRDFRFP